MTASERNSLALRVAILTPTGKDAQLTAAVLRESEIETAICRDIACVEEAIQEGLGSLLVAEEALGDRKLEALATALCIQPPWSDLPVLLLTRYGADSSLVNQALQVLNSVTLLERPVRPATLLSVVQTALKARERQYQVRAHILERERFAEVLRDTDRRKDEFLAMLAHELRNPLAPIRSGLDILAIDSDRHQEVVKLMQEQMEHVVRLVDDLLDVSRIMRNRIELRKERVQLATLIKQSVAAVRPLIDSQQQVLLVSVPKEPIWLNVDPVRLAQVIENLLNNASKYTDVGGIIELAANREDGQVLVSVKDTGVGIELELLPRVFELFTQSSRSLDRAQGGLGIGLTLVQQLVEMHGGTVSAQSDGLGHGSTFTVRLPVMETASLVEKAVAESNIAEGRCVLVVDDNEAVARMLSMLLARIGDHTILTAQDGPSALSKIKETHPDIVLLDIGLPGMDGYQIGRSIREIPKFDDVLLVALTGYGQEEDRQKSRHAGFDEHLVKPPSVEQIKEILGHSKLRGRSQPSRGDCSHSSAKTPSLRPRNVIR